MVSVWMNMHGINNFMILTCNHCINNYLSLRCYGFRYHSNMRRFWCICLRNTYVSVQTLSWRESMWLCHGILWSLGILVFNEHLKISLSLSLSLSLSSLIHVHLRCEIARCATRNECIWLCMFPLEQHIFLANTMCIFNYKGHW